MSNYQQNNQQIREVIWNLSTMAVYAQPLEGSKRKPSFKLDYRKNRVRLVVRTGVENDKDYGRMVIDLPPPAFQALILLVEKVANIRLTEDVPEYKEFIEVYRPDFMNKGSGKQIKAGEVIIGKDKAGMVFISVHMHGRPCPKFEWGSPNNWIRYKHATGEAFKPSELSVMEALAWAKLMSNTLPIVMNRFYEAENFGNNNNNNGGNNNGGYNGGGNRQNNGGQQHGGYNDVPTAQDPDDDLPF